MFTDNPALRVYVLLKDIHQLQSNLAAMTHWKQIFEVEETVELYQSLSNLILLERTAFKMSCELMPSQSSNAAIWHNSIHAALSSHNLHDEWRHFTSKISTHALSLLHTSADFLELKLQSHESVDNERFEEIKQKINELLSDVVSDSSMPPAIKNYLVRSLHKLLNSIDEFRLTGADGLSDAVDAIYGHIVINPEFRSFAKTESGSKLAVILSSLNDCISILTGTPPLLTSAKDWIQSLPYIGN